jgi:hypothetical protein
LISVAIPNSVTNIVDGAFQYCSGLTNLTIGSDVIAIGLSAFANCSGLTGVVLPSGLIVIKGGAFRSCSGLTNIVIPTGVTTVGDYAFQSCSSLRGLYFQGNAPYLSSLVTDGDPNLTVYNLPGTTGWGPTYDGRPLVLWLPQAQTTDASFGVRTNRFGFNMKWASSRTVVVEACTALANPSWSPVSTNTFTNGSVYFSDSKWTNYPNRYYRIRWP